MMMTGARQLTTSLGLMEETPPETIVGRVAPRAVHALDRDTRSALTELAHWGYGAVGGACYGLLPRPVRSNAATGPVYGLAVWLAFELGIAPLLGLRHPQGRVAGRVMLVVDHALYGIVVADRFAPEEEVVAQQRV
jgi:hypothetical protein